MLHPENLCFVLLSSFVYSLIEIELEANEGWMKKIPTAKVVDFGGKRLTLYHIYMILMITISVCFQNRMSLTISSFLHSASYVFLFLLLEDILWFVFNPYYTMKKYKKDCIWWHANQPWVFGIPQHNYVIVGINLSISYLTGITDIAFSVFYSFIFLGICIHFAPFYHAFYKNAHNKHDLVT